MYSNSQVLPISPSLFIPEIWPHSCVNLLLNTSGFFSFCILFLVKFVYLVVSRRELKNYCSVDVGASRH